MLPASSHYIERIGCFSYILVCFLNKKNNNNRNNIIIPGSRKFYCKFFTKPLINGILNTQVKYNAVI